MFYLLLKIGNKICWRSSWRMNWGTSITDTVALAINCSGFKKS